LSPYTHLNIELSSRCECTSTFGPSLYHEKLICAPGQQVLGAESASYFLRNVSLPREHFSSQEHVSLIVLL